MRVGIFYNSISNPNKFSNKTMLMDNFRAGVRCHGDEVVEFRDNNLPDQGLDAGFVLGYTLEDNFRKKIIDRLERTKTSRVFVDSNILHYARQEHEWHRYSLNSVYPNKGIYFFGNLDLTKWDRFSAWHNVKLAPWRTQGNHVMILCQRPKGWNMFGEDQDLWLDRMIEKIYSITPDRPIRVRMHPNDGARHKQIDKLRKRYDNYIEISDAADIRTDLEDCWCVVGYNSTPNVVAALEGVPVYLTDPKHSWAADVAFNDIKLLADPLLPDRTQWVHHIANIHWSNDEVRSGMLWHSIKQYLLNRKSAKNTET